ncbi:uncharacterized protein LOC126904264 isoform X3 [Daktulosphaira vitifoliae]|uniref:uncharacterized protein LOC126904264 isoform X3 n=1 Tax=Daktulosphaira vitifoliae TaxID=58002 RepID=UPI0021AA47A4|nr:uncharacterized protein LOC126904264 isoform X3 [Daktulosphaira vitifoliae]
MFLLNIFGILWLSHNIILITAIPGGNWFSKLFSSNSYSRLPSDLSIPLNNEDSTFQYHDQIELDSTHSNDQNELDSFTHSNNLVVHVTSVYRTPDKWNIITEYVIGNHRFQPVDSEWQKNISEKLGFPIGKPYNLKQLNKMLKSPIYNEDVKVTLDTNEFFRIISLLFSGSQENYEILRIKVFETIISTNYIVKLLGDECYVNEYFRTDTVKMLATSFVIETCIYIYVKAMGKWLYLPIEFHKENFSKIHEEKCIYLYDEGTHFFIVEDVAD